MPPPSILSAAMDRRGHMQKNMANLNQDLSERESYSPGDEPSSLSPPATYTYIGFIGGRRSIREFQPDAPAKVVLSAPATAPSDSLHPDVSAMAVPWAAAAPPAAHPRASVSMRRPWPFSRRRRLTGRWPF
jgi:hypothetical protein